MSNTATAVLATQGNINAATASLSAENVTIKAQCTAILKKHPETIGQYQEFSKCVQVIFPENTNQKNADMESQSTVILLCMSIGLVICVAIRHFTKRPAYGFDWRLAICDGASAAVAVAFIAAFIFYCVQRI